MKMQTTMYMNEMKTQIVRVYIVLTVLFFSFKTVNSQDHTIYLIGNSYELEEGSELESLLKQQFSEASKNSSLVFLGDNISPTGVSDSLSSNWGLVEQKIIQLSNLLKLYKGETYFIPGDRDWKEGKRLGWQSAERQQLLIDSVFQQASVQYLPKSSCPGIEEINLSEQVTLLIADSQWLLHPWDKPKLDSECGAKSVGEVISQLESALKRNAHKRVVFATHHHVISQGKYGTRNFGSLQYSSHPKTNAFSKVLNDLLGKYDNVVHVSGHEKVFQHLVDEQTSYVTSGAVGEISKVKPDDKLKFSSLNEGLTSLKFQTDGKTHLIFQTKNGIEYNQVVMDKPYQSLPSIDDFAITQKTIITNSSDQYDKENVWFGGENYRKVWKQKREFPVFDIGKEHGGLTITQRGGGQQTRSLRLEAKDGREYVLRSIEKYTEKAVPEALRTTFAAGIIQDQISASHPYGAFVVPFLADKVGVYHTNPKAVYIPKDPRFGIHQEDFANTICLYEERVAGNQSEAAYFGNSKKIISTPKMILKLYEDNDNSVDQLWVIKSRLFDMFIADWDRHDDQWRWAQFKDGKGKMYRPVPRDRDQAFFVGEGLMMNLGTKKWGLTKFQGFDYEFKWAPGFNFNGRYFDRDFANEPSMEDWLATADTLQSILTDKVIEDAIKQWPEEIYQHRGEEIIAKLKSQRSHLKEYAEEHYLFLAKNVNVEGSDKREYFKIERLDDERTRVRMYKSTKKDKKDSKLYDRTFFRSETKEIRLYGLGGKDEFKVFGKVKKGIKLRIIGGSGKDEIKDESIVTGPSKKTWVYDTPEGNEMKLGKESRDKTSSDPIVNEYNRKEFKHDKVIPIILASINRDDGIFIGGGFMATKQGFRKFPFKSNHLVTAKYALATSAYSFQYKGKFTDVIGKWSFGLNLKALAPNYVTNYFGPGNESVFDQQADITYNLEDKIDYYRTRFRQYSAETFFYRNLGEKVALGIGHHWQSFEVMDDYDGENRFVLDYADLIADEDFFEREVFDGIMVQLEYDGRDSKVMPTHGIHANVDLRGYVGADGGAEDFTKFEGELSYFKTIRLPAKITFATRIGAGHNFGEYEFYQAQVLNGNTDIRGYRKTRFFGDSKLYNNTELRARLFNFRNKIVPMSIGLTLFNDIGRVWIDEEKSDKWHHGYGTGIWFAPLNALLISVDLATSEEENLIGYFKMGFRF
jgi:hypothetical protein